MTPAYDHLKNGQQQADADGIMVTVSRQAVDEVLAEYDELEAENRRLRRGMDNIKVRAYELGQIELHDKALAALEGE